MLKSFMVLAVLLFLSACQPITVQVNAETRDAANRLVERTTYRAVIVAGGEGGLAFREPALRPASTGSAREAVW